MLHALAGGGALLENVAPYQVNTQLHGLPGIRATKKPLVLVGDDGLTPPTRDFPFVSLILRPSLYLISPLSAIREMESTEGIFLFPSVRQHIHSPLQPFRI